MLSEDATCLWCGTSHPIGGTCPDGLQTCPECFQRLAPEHFAPDSDTGRGPRCLVCVANSNYYRRSIWQRLVMDRVRALRYRLVRGHKVDEAYWDGFYDGITGAMSGIADGVFLTDLPPEARLSVINYLDSMREDALK